MEKKLNKVLVTGGAGFIGSHLVDYLIEKNIEVTVFDNLSNGNEKNLAAHLKNQQLTFVEGDIRDKDALKSALEGVDAVVHLAAVSDVFESMKNPEITMEINSAGTACVIRACQERGITRVVLASSASVYGIPVSLPVKEGDAFNPLSPYAASKVSAEMMANVANESLGMSVFSLRFFNVYGPRQNPGSPYCGVITKFKEKMEKGEDCLLNSGGVQTRDFVNVKDVARAIHTCLNSPNSAQKVFNVGTGKAITIKELAILMNEFYGNKSRLVEGPEQKGDIPHSVAEVELARELIGFEAEIEFREGISSFLEAKNEN